MNILIHGIIGAVGMVVFFASISMASYKAGYQQASSDAGKYAELKAAFLAYDDLSTISATLPDGQLAACYPKSMEWQNAYERVREAAGRSVYWAEAPSPLFPAATPSQGEDQ